MKKLSFFVVCFFFVCSLCFGDTIVLKSGKKFTGPVVENTKGKIRLEVGGVPLTFWNEDIESLNGEPIPPDSPLLKKAEVLLESKKVEVLPESEKVIVLPKSDVDLYQEALKEMKDYPKGKVGEFYDHEVLLEVEKNGWQDNPVIMNYLRDNKKAIDLFKKATQQENMGSLLTRKDLASDQQMKIFFKYIALLRPVLVEAHMLMAKGRHKESQDNILASVGFLKHFSQQKQGGLLINVMYEIIFGVWEPTFKKIIREEKMESSFYEKLLKQLLSFPQYREQVKNTLMGERLYAIQTTKELFLKAQESQLENLDVFESYLLAYDKETQKILDAQITALNKTDKDLVIPSAKDIIGEVSYHRSPKDELSYDIEDNNGKFEVRTKNWQPWLVFMKKVGPENAAKADLVSRNLLEKQIPVNKDLASRINLFTTATAMTLSHLDQKKFPEKLNELVPRYLPQVPEDPFNHFAPMKYVVSENGYLIYSIGPDGIDQKGKIVSSYVDGYTEAGDVILLIEK